MPVVAAVAIGLSAAAVASGITGFDDYLPMAGIVALFSLAISAQPWRWAASSCRSSPWP